MSFYPEKISRRFYERANFGRAARANAVGTGVAFVCGSFVRFYLEIDPRTKEIREARFRSNGCGYAVAAADALAEMIAGRPLTELHGLDHEALGRRLGNELGRFDEARAHCAKICLDALAAAFADFRALQLEEFAGEKALICTCFGVSEETIEKVIEENESETVEEVGELCRAGTGCGSCQFLIRELLDVHRREGR
jgi:NifU-like protein